MKFAHLGDCHLGSWRQPELKALNFQSFEKAIDISIKEKVDFILITGDLFDSSYPPIDTLKDAFQTFKKIKDANIPVFLIAGSHDYSVSGKSFLDVLERAGFCKNVYEYEEKDGKIILLPTIYKNVAIYGFPGKKSGLEVDEIAKIKLQDSPLFKILMLHTTIRAAAPNYQIKAVDETLLPKIDYLALGHLHIKFHKNKAVYSGPTFPNSLLELEDLQSGSFCIFNSGELKRYDIKLKEVYSLNLEIKDSISATEQILKFLMKENLKDKIVVLRVHGVLNSGKTSDIDFTKIESFVRKAGAYVFLKSTSRLHVSQPEITLDLTDTENLETEIIKKFEESNPSRFNYLISSILRATQIEKLEDERAVIFEERLISESKKIIKDEVQ